MSRPLRIAIDVRMPANALGGVTQVVIGLAVGLSALRDGEEEYFFLVNRGEGEWLAPYLGGPCRLLEREDAPAAPDRFSVKGLARRALAGHGPEWLHRMSLRPPRSDGTLERTGIDVVHFTHQTAFVTEIPSIYNPHDLQHRHYPQYFTPRERAARETIWRLHACRAAVVSVTSSWVREDVIRQWGLPSDRVHVIPWAPVISHYAAVGQEDVARARRELKLPESFVLYPAQTWPHKNHLALARAIARIAREGGPSIPVVCTGGHTRHAPQLREELGRLGVSGLFNFTGHIDAKQLRAVYLASRAVVVPSLFEAASFPVWEAFECAVPVACSTATSLPEQVGDAGLLFDPASDEQIASSIRRIWDDEELRKALVARGTERVKAFTWDRTARAYRAEYRRIAGRQLSREDAACLSAPPSL